MIKSFGKEINWDDKNVWAISAKLGINIDRLNDFLVSSAAMPDFDSEDVVVTNIRHYEGLKLALEDIKRVLTAIDNGLPGDIVSEELRACVRHLSEIVGEVTNAEVLQSIFENFCIGK